MNEDIIYLLKTDNINNNEFVYKIGRSTQPKLNRLTAYPKTYKIIITRSCIDCIYVEKKLIELFNNKYKKAYKNEYFIGSENGMIHDINKIIEDEYTASLINKSIIVPKENIKNNQTNNDTIPANNSCKKRLTIPDKDTNNMSHISLAKSCHMKYSERFVCSNIKNNTWWKLENNKWIRDESDGYFLKILFSENLQKEYEIKNTNIRLKEAATLGIEKETIKQKRMHIKKYIELLSNNRFRNILMNECKYLFYDPEFEQKLNSNSYENRLYDLNSLD